MTFLHTYDSPLGRIILAADGVGLTGLWFEGQKYFGSTMDAQTGEKNLPVFEQTDRWLNLYFAGRIPDFTPPLHLRGTAFRRAVWEALPAIPYGMTVTYGALADKLGSSARAVGNAVGHNPVSLIIPCHRVVGADGSLTGYAGGVERKDRLLRMEGAVSKRLPFYHPEERSDKGSLY